jgi:hypothetical protein
MVVSLEESDDLEQENVNSLLAQPSLRASSGVPKTTVWTIKSGWLALIPAMTPQPPVGTEQPRNGTSQDIKNYWR